MEKVVYILRAVPGSGKSTVADTLTSNKSKSSVICSADDYFMINGEYKYSGDKISNAHEWCQQLFSENLLDETEIIVVDNTNVRTKDVETYRNLAIEHGYMVFVLTVENWHNGINTHNVSEETLVKMESVLKSNIKLR